MRLNSHPTHIPATSRTFRRLLLTVLLSSAVTQSSCIPYPLRFQEQVDSDTRDDGNIREDIMDSNNDISLDTTMVDTDSDTDSGMDTREIGIDTDSDIDSGMDTRETGVNTDSDIDSGMDTRETGVNTDSDIDSGMDTRETGIDVGPSDVLDTNPGDRGSEVDTGSFIGPCRTSLTIGPDITLPVIPSPGISTPFGAAIGRDGRLNIVHLTGGHLFFTSVSSDGRTAVVPTIDVNADLTTAAAGNKIPIACSSIIDQCITSYRHSPLFDLVTVRINPLTGTRIGTETVLDALTTMFPHQITYNQLNNTYGIVYTQSSGPLPWQAFFSLMNSDGMVMRNTGLSTLSGTNQAILPSITTAPNASTYMVAYQDNITGVYEIYTRFFSSATGGSLGSSTLLPSPTTRSDRPSLRTVRSIEEYRLDWLESGDSIYTYNNIYNGGGSSRSTRVTITGTNTASFIHSAEQFVAWNNSSEFDVALFGQTLGSVISNQPVVRSTFLNFKPQVLSTGPITGKVIFINSDGNLHMVDLSCR